MLSQQNFYRKLPLPEEQDLISNQDRDHIRGFKSGNLQDIFLNNCRKNEDSVRIEITNGSEKRGKIIGFDSQAVILGDERTQQMIYKHNITSITPEEKVQYIFSENRRHY